MWDSVPAGTCVEKWLDILRDLGGTISKVKEPDWYRIWCPRKVEFHHFQVSKEIADNCVGLEARLNTMESVKELL